MLFKETTLLKEEKKRICATIFFLNNQFDKLIKNQNNIIKNYYDSVEQNAKTIFGNEQYMKYLLEEQSNST